MSMFVYKGERGGVKNALDSVYVVCTQSLTDAAVEQINLVSG